MDTARLGEEQQVLRPEPKAPSVPKLDLSYRGALELLNHLACVKFAACPLSGAEKPRFGDREKANKVRLLVYLRHR